ncbi:DUF502 domain-containing protein [Bdellovibrio bacteriovorus]|uniref:DUF502 domain-containing protein n=1 Tax=Bdellovibrio bacteriovorus TaxID=959 RepID=UPI0035A6A0EF
MGTFGKFLKSTFSAAAGVVLPLALIVLILQRLFQALSTSIAPLAKAIFPQAFIDRYIATEILTLIVLLMFSMLIGLIAQTRWGQSFGHWLEDRTLGHLPIYRTLKEFSERLIPSDKDNVLFQPALLIRGDEMNTFVYIVEKYGEDHVVIFVPSVPSTLSGSLCIVPKTDVRVLPVPALAMAKVFSRWGVGTSKILDSTQTSPLLQKSDRLDTEASSSAEAPPIRPPEATP